MESFFLYLGFLFVGFYLSGPKNDYPHQASWWITHKSGVRLFNESPSSRASADTGSMCVVPASINAGNWPARYYILMNKAALKYIRCALCDLKAALLILERQEKDLERKQPMVKQKGIKIVRLDGPQR